MIPRKLLEAAGQRLARMIAGVLPPGVGFTIVLFTLDHEGWLTYVSNAERADMIRTLDELLTRWKAQQETGATNDQGVQA